MKHIIGIDFGTSTSMIKVAARDGSSLETKEVKFTQYGIGSTPTLIRKKDGGVVWYGQDAAQNERMDTVLHRNFKLDLKSEDPAKQQQAVELLEEFYRFLHKTYSEQKNFLIGTDSGEVETVVSYPAQWGKEQQEAVVSAAKKAGFPNVTGMDEPTAAVICVLKAKQKELEDSGLLRAGKPLNIMIVDMGAGTTDLAFVTVTVENDGIHTSIRETWPKAGSAQIYGGSQMDLRLEAIIENWLAESGIEPTMVQNLSKGQRNNIKSWKESTLSALLEKDLTVDECSAITYITGLMHMSVNPFPAISRENFADHFRTELESFVNVIASAPQNLRDETELVILTGGNSVWYWVRPIVLGIDTRFGDVGLKNIRRISNRVLQMEQPADTVSRGLVYDKASFRLAKVQKENVMSEDKQCSKTETMRSERQDAADSTRMECGHLTIQSEPQIVSDGVRIKVHIGDGSIHRGDIVQWLSYGNKYQNAEIKSVYSGGFYSNTATDGMTVDVILSNMEAQYLQNNANSPVLRCLQNSDKHTHPRNAEIPTNSGFQMKADNVAESSSLREPVLERHTQADRGKLIESGKCGDHAFWALFENGEMEISGIGEMYNYQETVFSLKINTPWKKYRYRKQTKKITVKENITSIGDFAFECFFNLETIVMSENIEYIGKKAFAGCSSLKYIYFGNDIYEEGTVWFPPKLKKIGIQAFTCYSGGDTGYWYRTVKEVHISKDTIYDDFSDKGTPNRISGKTFDGCKMFFYSPEQHTENAPESKKAIDTAQVSADTDNSNDIAEHCSQRAQLLERHAQTGKGKLIASGKCGEHVSWALYENGEMEISGIGKMYDYEISRILFLKFNTPWFDYRKQIKMITVKDKITSIGAYAFADFEHATIFIPASVKTIGDWAFRGVTEIYFLGDKPAFEKKPSDFYNHSNYYYLEGMRGWNNGDLPLHRNLTWIQI